ncbi:hypothetical protein I203_106855 [Kwoniella mangroviensis CBS 8507]|uniref:hypothetical protein n=1 Tax=Kwoniella mangroviensis CBS 8507 TaxID=1296122 RepID=UPI00304BD220
MGPELVSGGQPDRPSDLSEATPSSSMTLVGNSAGGLNDLIKLYFRTVHHFGYLSFVHEADYWELKERNCAPEDLSLLMAAHAVRFGGRSRDLWQLELADRTVVDVGERLTSKVLDEFGAVELMEVVLCQTYDFLNGRYQRGMVMAGMAVRMMTFLRLHELDEWPRQTAKPLLSKESLRRLAWSVWYLDATLDGGVFGASNIHEDAFTIQLPCEDRPFLLHRQVVTEHLVPRHPFVTHPGNLPRLEPVDLSGHLIRAMAARQCLAQAYSRIRRRLLTHGSTTSPGFVARNTDQDKERQKLISNAIKLSQILGDAIAHDVSLDPQIAMHAYNAIEIFLFQPLRLPIESIDPQGLSRERIVAAIKPLLHVMRAASTICPLVNLIYPEAINRMVQMGYLEDLTNEDILAVLQKVHCLTNADKEFDWTESFWRYEVLLSRRSRIGATGMADPEGPTDNGLAESPEDTLLEVPPALPTSRAVHVDSPSSTNQQIVNMANTPQSLANDASLAPFGPGSPVYEDGRNLQLAADPISRLQDLFATRGPETNAGSPAPYVAISDLTSNATVPWPFLSMTVHAIPTAQLGQEDAPIPFPWK